MTEHQAERYQQSSFGYMAAHMARLFAGLFAERLRGLGLAPAQYVALIELWEGAPMTQRALISKSDVEQATMGNTLKRMERDGLITRRQDPNDGRAHLIYLTDRAVRLEPAAKKVGKTLSAAGTANLTPEEQQILRTLMMKVIENLKNEFMQKSSSR